MDRTDLDSGMCWECGSVWGRKPVVLYRTDIRSEAEPFGPYNLMRTSRRTVRPQAFGWPASFPVRYLWSLLRWEGQRMGAVGEPRKRPHCLMCFGYGGD
jgi:hypothetical protein